MKDLGGTEPYGGLKKFREGRDDFLFKSLKILISNAIILNFSLADTMLMSINAYFFSFPRKIQGGVQFRAE